MDEIVKKIRAVLASNDVPLWGVAESASMENGPSGYRPTDTLASAKNLLCMGVPVPRGIFQGHERTTYNYWRSANIFYRNMDMILLQIARIIEEQGEVAVPVFGCFPYDVVGPGDLRGYVSLVRMAETAGLGKTGKNGLLFSSRYGPRLLLGGILTTAVLPEMVLPARDNAGCPEGCSVCREHCPVGAIEEQGKVDRLACVKYSMKSPIFSYLMKTKAFDPSDAAMINHVTGVDDHSMYTCIDCVSRCPYC